LVPINGQHLHQIIILSHFLAAFFIQNSLYEAIWRISYMAKIRGKGYRDPQANDYQTSRLKDV